MNISEVMSDSVYIARRADTKVTGKALQGVSEAGPESSGITR